MPKVLIVDDERDNLELMERRLKRRGFDVSTASTAEAGLALAFQNAPDIILMDWMMPQIDGLEATRRLKADEQTRAIPVIIFSAKSLDSERLQAAQAGADGFETKPVDLAKLLDTMARLIPNPPGSA